MITVKLFAYLRDGIGKEISLDEKEFPNVQKIIDHYQIAADRVSILLINGFHAALDTPLQSGDLVSLFPPVAGG